MKPKLLLLFLTSCCALSVRADQAILIPDHDNTIFAETADQSNSDGGALGFFVGTNSTNAARRALLSFDLTSGGSGIPANATITGVTLTLTLVMTAGTNSTGMLSLYDVTQSWGEGTANQGQALAGHGNGAAAGTGDATWLAAHFSQTPPTPPTTSWTNSGGDFNSTASATKSLTGNSAGTPYTVDSALNPQMITDVQNWVDGATANYGWELLGDESRASSFYGFDSREASSGQPQLVVTYVPEPSALALQAAAPLAWLTQRRRVR